MNTLFLNPLLIFFFLYIKSKNVQRIRLLFTSFLATTHAMSIASSVNSCSLLVNILKMQHLLHLYA